MKPRTSHFAAFLAACFLIVPASVRAQEVLPKPLGAPTPSYPDTLTDTGISGEAEVDVVVTADGSVKSAELATANQRAFGKTALTAVKTWHFQPGTRDGVPVEMELTIPFVFTAPLDQQVNALARRKVYVKLADPVLTAADYGSKLKLKKDAEAVYPRGLFGSRADETVEVNFIVAPDGTTLNPVVVGTPRKEFIVPALVAVAKKTYTPPAKNGSGVYVATSTKISFSPEQHNAYESQSGGRHGGGGGGMSGGGMGGGGGGMGGGMGGR